MPVSIPRRALRAAVRCALLAAVLPLAAHADDGRESCSPDRTDANSARGGRGEKGGSALVLSAAHPAGLVAWDVRHWQRHRLWVTLAAANDGEAAVTLQPQLAMDGEPPDGVPRQLAGLPLVVAPHAKAQERMSIYVPEDVKALGMSLGEAGTPEAVSATFAFECSDERSDPGTLAVPAARLLQLAVPTYLERGADPVTSPRAAADLALRLASGAQDASDIAWAMRGVMQSVHDVHGFIVAPGEPVPGPPPARAARAPDFEWLQDGVAVVHLHGGDAGSPEQVRALAAALHDGVAAFAARRPRGWIVDLRGNDGDDPWPALAGLSTLLAGPNVGSTQGPGGRDDWIVERGALRMAGGPTMIDLQAPPEPPFEGPLAVLVDGDTSNEGEVVAVAFQGRPHTRFFGAPTAGCPSWCVRTHVLAGGTTLGLVEVRPSDRNGRVQREPIQPDGLLTAATARDAAPRKAVDWVLDERSQAR